MYKNPKTRKSNINCNNSTVGQQLHTKIQDILENGDQNELKQKPIIYTEKSEGVKEGYNIRTDKWEIACETADKMHKIRAVKGEEKAKGKLIKMNENKNIIDGQAESVDGTKE